MKNNSPFFVKELIFKFKHSWIMLDNATVLNTAVASKDTMILKRTNIHKISIDEGDRYNVRKETNQ